MTDDVKALVERAKRWTMDTGYDGGPNSVPMQMIAALTAQAEEIERLRGIVRLFTGAAYPVAPEINERGHNWSEAYLDQALKAAQEVKV